MTANLETAARENLGEWADAEPGPAVMFWTAFVRSYRRLPAEEQADLIEVGKLAVASAPDAEAKARHAHTSSG